MGKIFIKNGKVWDGEQFIHKNILICDEKIEEITDNFSVTADFVYDAHDKIVSTGLVDIHTHFLGFYGINAEMSCIPFGVTSAADAAAEPDCKNLYESFLVKNKVFVSAEIKNNKAVFKNTENVLKHYGDKAVGLKVYFDTGICEVSDTSPLKEICDFAKSRSLPVMVHSSNSPVKMYDLISALNKGDILTHAYHGGKNSVQDDNFECLKYAKEKGVIIDAGFAGNVHTDFGVFENALKNGCSPDTISTDITRFSAYKRGGKYGMTMCMSIAKKFGMNEEEIFRSVTSTPAKVLGMHNEWGYLKVGRCADISVFDYFGDEFSLTDNSGNTVKDENSYNCVLCICNGEVVYRN